MKRQVIGMKERINRLAKGIIDSEQPKMTWSPEKIDETLRMNTLMQRNLWIGSENGLSVKGFVYSSNLRVRIPGDNNSFGGLRCRIVYEVDTSFLTAGDTITGSFYLVTNCGEEEIPYEFHVEVADAGKTLGDLKTAEDFLRVAENDMETALRLLEYPDFVLRSSERIRSSFLVSSVLVPVCVLVTMERARSISSPLWTSVLRSPPPRCDAARH